MRIARPRVLFIAPTLPALTGNGLAMRMGVFAEALARWADVDLAVVPVAGGGVENTPFLQSLELRLLRVSWDRRPDTHYALLSRVAIQVDLTELLERAVREELHNGRAGETWAALRQAGVPESAELTQLAARLKGAHQALDRLDQEMQAKVAQAGLKQHAAGLVRRQVQARQERAAALA